MQISFRGLAVGKLFQPFAIIDSNVQKRSILSRNRIFLLQYCKITFEIWKITVSKKWDSFVSKALNQK